MVYTIDEDSRFYSKSHQLLDSNFDLFTTSKNLSEFLAVVTRGKPISLSIENALAVVKDFSDVFTILYPTESSFGVFKELLQKYKPAGLKVHDFEIVSIGLANGINQIATSDSKDFEGIKEINIEKIGSITR